MSRPRSAGGVFWGLILIAAGAIFLLRNLGYSVPVWTGIARYWPVLLIVWGAVKLFDYARWRKAGETGPLFGAGEIVLLIVVVVAGSALTAAANINSDLGYVFEGFDVDLWGLNGNSYEYTEHYERDVPPDSAIEVINRYGSVEISPGDVDRIVVDVAKTVVARTQEDANELAKQLNYSIVEEGRNFRVISNFNRDENRIRGRRLRTSLTIRVPKRARLTVDNRNGDVTLSGVTGEQKLTNAFGRMEVTSIAGDIQINNRNGDVLVETIEGTATIRNEFASVAAKGVKGALDINHRNGNVEVSDIGGKATISNAFGSVDAKDLRADVTVDVRNTSVELFRVQGDVSVKNQFQYVRLEDVKGAIDVNNRNGAVELRNTEPPAKDIRVDSQFGDVTVAIPSRSAFSVDARTRWGSVDSDFSELSRNRENERESLSGRVGSGGPEIRIENRNGSIRIEK
jgi:DUF4097 and DUF4098 domain-containing protein YvlB